MKKKIFSASLFLIVTTFTVLGQYRYSSQYSSHIAVSPTLNKGFDIQIGIEKYLRNAVGSIRVNFDYVRYQKFIQVTDFHISIPTLTAQYIYSLDRIIRPPFFINIGAGVFLGTEIFEKQTLPYGVVQQSGGTFVWGLQLSPEFEYLISRRFSCYIRPEIRYHFKARFDKTIICSGIGAKLYF